LTQDLILLLEKENKMTALTVLNKILAFVLCVSPVVFAIKINLLSLALAGSFVFCILCVFIAFIF